MRILAFLVLSATTFAQSAEERTFLLSNTADLHMQELTTVFRSITEVREVALDPAQKALRVRGDKAQLALAEWTINEFDRPPQSGGGAREFSVAQDDVVRVFQVSNVSNLLELQELATTVRSVAEVRRMFVYAPQRTIAMRGTREEAAAAEWLIGVLDVRVAPAAGEYRIKAPPENVTRIFHVAQASSPQEMQELATVVRSVGEIRRAFIYRPKSALVMRGTAEQMALAEWLLAQLTSEKKGAAEFRVTAADDVARVFFMPRAGSPQRLHEITARVRTSAKIRRMFIFTPGYAVAMRGTATEGAEAARLIAEAERELTQSRN